MKAILALALAGLAGAAEAGLDICNETGSPRDVAIGYQGETDWTSEGWWSLDPGACARVIDGDLRKRYVYYLVHPADGVFAGEGYAFCIGDQAFTILGDTACEARGHRTGDFAQIDTGPTATQFTYTLTGGAAPPPPPEPAPAPDPAPEPPAAMPPAIEFDPDWQPQSPRRGSSRG